MASRACHQDLAYRPDFKLLGSYTLPFDILFSGTYQFVRGIQNAAAVAATAAPSILATWTGMRRRRRRWAGRFRRARPPRAST